MQTLVIEAKIENLDKVNEFIHEFISKFDFPRKPVMQLDLAVEEIFANIANYAYTPKIGEVKIFLELEEGNLSLTFIDRGVPYNPLEKSDPDVNLPIEEREIGGLGVFLAKKLVDEISYKHSDGQNILTVEKFLAK